MAEEEATIRLHRSGPEIVEPAIPIIESFEPQEPAKGTLVWSLVDRVSTRFVDAASIKQQIYTGPHQLLEDDVAEERQIIPDRMQSVGKMAAFINVIVNRDEVKAEEERKAKNPFDDVSEREATRYVEELLNENSRFNSEAEESLRKSMRMVHILPAIALLAGDESTYAHLSALSDSFREDLADMDAGDLGVAQLARGTMHEDPDMVEAGAINLMQGMHERHPRQRFELLYSGYAVSGHDAVLEQAVQAMGSDYYMGMRLIDHVVDIGGDADEVQERIETIEQQVESLSRESNDLWAPVLFKAKKLEAITALRDRPEESHDDFSPRSELYGYDIQTLGQELMFALVDLDNQIAPALDDEGTRGSLSEVAAKRDVMLPYVAGVLTSAFNLDGAPGLVNDSTRNLTNLREHYEPDSRDAVLATVQAAEMGIDGASVTARDMIDDFDINDRNLGFDSLRYRVYRSLLHESGFYDDSGNLMANARIDDIPKKTQMHAAFMGLVHNIASSPDPEQSRFDMRGMLSPASEKFELLEYMDRRNIFFKDVAPETATQRYSWYYRRRDSVEALSRSLGKTIDYSTAAERLGERAGSIDVDDQWIAYLGLLHAPTLNDKIEFLSEFPTNTLYQPTGKGSIAPPSISLWWPRQRAGVQKPRADHHV